MNKFGKFQTILVAFLISVSTFYGGYYVGKRGYVFELKRNPPEIEVINRYPSDQQVDFERFWEVWDLLQTSYLDRPVNPDEMLQGAISGLVQSLGDPYTSYLPPQINETVTSALNGNYQGIGAELAIKDEQLIVVTPLDGSPAKSAGVKAGDKILKIEDESTIGITLNEAVYKIRGEAGTNIALTLQRESLEPFVVQITRGVINVPSVTWEDKGDGTAYIRVSRFGGDTNQDWSKAVAELNSEMAELDAVIVDLRGNPGGYLQSAVYLAEEFFTGETVLYQEAATGEQVAFDAKRVGALESVPSVIVLINEGSASASEILAAALKANVDATLVGQKSFGKGTIQDAKNFTDGSGIHITVAKWLTPEKVWVHENGITPDLVVEQDEGDFENGEDTQLNVALDLAKQI